MRGSFIARAHPHGRIDAAARGTRTRSFSRALPTIQNSAYRIEQIHDSEMLDRIAPAWRELSSWVEVSLLHTIYESWRARWSRCFAGGAELCVLTIWDADRLRGVALLRIEELSSTHLTSWHDPFDLLELREFFGEPEQGDAMHEGARGVGGRLLRRVSRTVSQAVAWST